MIVTFSVSNFRSFASEETFSLVASPRLAGNHDSHAQAIPNSKEQVLKTAVLYGANGAGKSNLFKALRYLKNTVLTPRGKSSGTGRQAFQLGQIEHQPSSFDLQFICANRLFRFGCKLNDQRILEEWLVQVSGKREKVIYERITDEAGTVKVEAPGLKNDKLRALATIGGPQNQLFLTTIRATLDEADFGDLLHPVFDWFDTRLSLISPDSSYAMLSTHLAEEADFLQFASDFLKSASTGVHALQVQKQELSEEELRKLLPSDIASKVVDDLSTTDNASSVIRLGNGKEFLFEKTDQAHYYQLTIQAGHQVVADNMVTLDLAEESDGTRRLLDLIPALYDMRNRDAVYVIDEIDRSLHPMLVRKFLECFLQSCDGGQRQVIVTTHESSLLDLDLLRRDEIWFVEKDDTLATRLYSLTDFKIRKDLEIRKHYLQGRFGAVPFLADLDRLMVEQTGAA
jgi:uncharacterized protein